MTHNLQDIGMTNFTRGGDVMEKVGVGVKKDLYKVSSIYVRLGRANQYHSSGLVYKSQMISELNIHGAKKGLRIINNVNKLIERSKIEYILDQKVAKNVSRLSIQNIFNFSASELEDATHMRITYRIASRDRHRGFQSECPDSLAGCKAVWKPTGDIVELKIKEIYFMEKDFWFRMLGMDYD
jgi:hypothetical protein